MLFRSHEAAKQPDKRHRKLRRQLLLIMFIMAIAPLGMVLIALRSIGVIGPLSTDSSVLAMANRSSSIQSEGSSSIVQEYGNSSRWIQAEGSCSIVEEDDTRSGWIQSEGSCSIMNEDEINFGITEFISDHLFGVR